ncbi:MAG: nitrate reductase NapE component [Moritella sp.]|jgi:nitrate reductase NapE component
MPLKLSGKRTEDRIIFFAYLHVCIFASALAAAFVSTFCFESTHLE